MNFAFLFLLIFLSSNLFAQQYGIEKKDRVTALLESGRMKEVEEVIRKEEKADKENSAYIFKLKSQLAFYRGDYNAAVSWIKKAYALSRKDKAVENMFLYYSAVKENTADFIQKESDHFMVRTKGKDIILQDYIIECMEQSYKVLGGLFEHYPYEKVVIEVYPDKDQFSLSSTLSPEMLERSGAIGICKFHRLMILSPRALLMGYRWQDALSHEFIHMLINHVSEFNTPLWLHEGTARYYDLLWRTEPGEKPEYMTEGVRAHLLKAVKDNTLIPFKRMHPSMVYLDSQDEVSLAFAEVSSMVDFILSQYRDDAIIRILKGFSKNSLEKNFKKILGKDAFSLEKMWIKHMKSLPQQEDKGAIGEKYIFDTSRDEIDEYVGADVRGHVRLGDKFRKNKRFSVALLQYNKALESEPENPVILTKLSRCFIALGRGKEAEEKLTLAVTKNPNYVTSHVLMGDLLFKEGRFNEALPYYKEANAINPFNPYIHKNMGKIYLNLDNKNFARRELSIASYLLPSDLELQHILSTLRE